MKLTILAILSMLILGLDDCSKPCGGSKSSGPAKSAKKDLVDIYTTNKGRIVIISNGKTDDYLPSNVAFKFDSETEEPYVLGMKTYSVTVVFKDRAQYRQYMYSEVEPTPEEEVEEEDDEGGYLY